MFERILLPLDGSELAELALPYAEELARALGSEVVLYHVRGHEHAQQEHMHQAYLDRLAESVRRNIKNGRPEGTEARVTARVDAGEPTENICNLVDKSKLDLIVMTAVSASGLRIGKMLGSVSDHVCRTVPIPVMLVRVQGVRRTDGKNRLINRILMPLDGSELSRLALSVGEELAATLRVSVTLFQMANRIRPQVDAMGSGAYIDYTRFDEAEEQRVSAEMIALEAELKGRGLDITQTVTSGSDAAAAIIEASKKIGADLVVMSTNGRSGLGRWVFGNVAEKVLRHGEIPLLLVHARAG